MKFKLSPQTKKIVLSFNFIAIIVAINISLIFLNLPRFDLTKNKIHTLSPSSHQILSDLSDTVNITVYMTDNLPPQAKPNIDSLKNILAELGHQNPSHIIITYKDPGTDDQIKQEALNLGIEPIQFSTIKQDSFQVNNAFLGLVVSFDQKKEVMPVVSDVGNLEYFILSNIKKITQANIPSLSIAIGHDQVDLSLVKNTFQYLSQIYSPVIVDTDSPDWQIPANSLLIILSPQQDFSPEDIDKFTKHLDQSGSMLVLFDRYYIDNTLTATKIDLPNFTSFLSNYGFKMGDSLVIDQSSNITSFSNQNSQFLSKYPFWPSINPDTMNTGLPILTNIPSINLNWVSPIEISGSAQYLLKSSQNSFVSQDINLSPVQQIDFKSQQLSQSVLSAINTDGVKIALVSDVDFIKDNFLTNEGNLIFFSNLVDYLNSDQVLMSIRNKTLPNYPLHVLTNQTKQILRWVNILSSPIVLFSIFLISKRNQTNFHRHHK